MEQINTNDNSEFYMRRFAYQYAKWNLSVIPIKPDKSPDCTAWKQYQKSIPDTYQINGMFHKKTYGLAIITGAVSDNLEVIDIDSKNDLTGNLFQNYMDEINIVYPGLIDKLVIAKTVNGGYHLVYRYADLKPNQKLASRNTTEEEKKLHPKEKIKVLIETRGEAGYIACAPSPGYELLQGTFESINTLSLEEHEVLINTAHSFNEVQQVFTAPELKPSSKSTTSLSPFEDYDNRVDIIQLLQNNGWSIVNENNDKITIKRPGDSKTKHSGYYNKSKKWLSVFSTSTEFEAQKAYKPYAVYTFLECNGDFSRASKQLYELGYGERRKMESEPKTTPNVGNQKTLASRIKTFNQLADEGKNLPPIKKVFGNFILENSTVLFPSERGVGKTYFMLQVANEVANCAKIFCGEKIEVHGNTLYINLELGETPMKRRLAKLHETRPPNKDSQYKAYCLTFQGNLLEFINELKTIFEKLKPCLVIIDNLRVAFREKDNEKNKEMTKAVMDFNDIKTHYNFALVIIHHAKKGSSGKLTDSDLQSGAGAITDLVDADFFLRKSKQDKNLRILKRMKSREVEEQEGAKLLRMNPKTVWFELVEEDVDEKDHIYEETGSGSKEDKKSAAFERKGQGKTQQDIAEELGVNKSTISRWFKEK